MNKTQYILDCFKHMNYGAYFQTANRLHKKTGRSRIGLLADMAECGLKYSAGYVDYEQASMYELNKAQRQQVVTRGVNNAIIVKYNDPAYYHCLDDKAEFNTRFASYLHRDWMLVESEKDRDKFNRFITGKKDWMLKPLHGEGGEGVRKLPAKPEVFDDTLTAVPYVAEEVVIQHPAMSALNPSSVNTLRMLTFLKENGTVEVAYVYLRVGYGDTVVDNFCSGGLEADVNLKTGRVDYPAVDTNYNPVTEHPLTHARILGFVVPYFAQAMEMVKKAALVVPEIRWTGWDVAITEKGPLIIEGNEYPGYLFNFRVQHDADYEPKANLEKVFGEKI